MAELTLTLKLPFYRLNQSKATEFERLTIVNTSVANDLLQVDKTERKKLTSAAFRHIEIGSMWINQTIRNTNSKTANRAAVRQQHVSCGGFAKVKHFKRMWLEVNNQGYEVLKSGHLYTLSFSLYRGRKGRIPLEVHSASHTEVLDKILQGGANLGSLKLYKSKKGIWYALLAVSMEVPDAYEVNGWIGIDRGQNNIAVTALPKGFGKFWKGGQVKGLRRQFQRTRTRLQETKQLKEVKRLEQRERRIMTQINHVISKQIVQFACDYGMGLRFC